MENIRVVIPGAHHSKWEVRRSFSAGPVISSHATQRDAIAAARLSLLPTGGQIKVCGLEGRWRRTIGVPAERVVDGEASGAGSATKPSDGPRSVAFDGADIAASAMAHAHGQTYDADGDGRDDGEAAVGRLLDTRDQSPSSMFFRGMDWAVSITLALVLPALAAFLGISIQGSELLGSTYWTVYLATIAWSGGVSVAVFFAALRPPGWGAWHYLGALGGGFALSNVVAAVLGGATMATPSNLAIPSLYRTFTVVPKNRQGLIGLVIIVLGFLVWCVVLAGLASYGVFGLLLGAGVGAVIGWQAAHRVKVAMAAKGQRLPGEVPP